jgi:hypothetical protein
MIEASQALPLFRFHSAFDVRRLLLHTFLAFTPSRLTPDVRAT